MLVSPVVERTPGHILELKYENMKFTSQEWSASNMDLDTIYQGNGCGQMCSGNSTQAHFLCLKLAFIEICQSAPSVAFYIAKSTIARVIARGKVGYS